jgi:hypothetical protein
MLNAFAAYRCWLLCLLQFVSIIVNYRANKGCNDLLEASENKVHHLSSILLS